MYSLHRSHHPVSLGSLPAGGDFRPGPAPFSATAPSAIWIPVECRGSDVPGKPIPCLCHALRFRPTRPTSPYRPARCRPRNSNNEDTRNTHFGTQYRGFGIRCLRFKWCVTAPACKTGFRLVVGLCRGEGSRTRWTSAKGFYPLHRTFSFSMLIMARRKMGQVLDGARLLLPANHCIEVHRDGYSCTCSWNRRTARSCTSGGYFFAAFPMAPSSPEMEPSGSPGQFKPAALMIPRRLVR